MNPDQYRGIFGSDGEKYAKDVQDLIEYGTCGRVAGFIAEAIQVLLLLLNLLSSFDELYDSQPVDIPLWPWSWILIF